jgi:LysM repeat protein
MMKKLLTIVVMLICGLVAAAQNLSPEQYIEQYKDLAIREMKRMGVPAAITLAQGLLETESGNSDLLKKSNNHFGIKCKNNWTGNGVSHDDDLRGECFRTYKDAEESYRDHSNFLRGNDRYSFLFKLDPADYKGWAYGLKKAGYATNPKYPAILIKHIEQYNLQQYSEIALGEVPKFESDKYESDKEVPFVYVEDSVSTGNAVAVSNRETASDINETTVAVNNVKCTFAKKGTSLLAIATKYDISLSKLLQFNDMEKDGLLDRDQLIFLEKKSTKGWTEYYVVKDGERLQDVAQKNGIQLESLAAYNQLDRYAVVQPGTKLYLQHAKPLETATANAEAASVKYHTVQPKEGLYTISKKYGVTVQQIKDWNNLNSNNLSVGQQLIVAKRS